jgi:hypothetical protein
MRIPTTNEKDLVQFALNTTTDCQVSQGQRAAAYRQYGQWVETGQAPAGDNAGLALCNLLYSHTDRLAAHLFSPSELRAAIDFESLQPKEWLDKGAVAARIVSRAWEAQNVDLLFGHGVKEALTYAGCLLKQVCIRDIEGNAEYKGARLVMPWQFGVYNEGVNDLADQEAFVETVWLNRHEVWRRIRYLPEPEKLFNRIIGNSKKEEGSGASVSFMHQVLSTSVLSTTGGTQGAGRPGGIVQLTNGPNYAPLAPMVAVDLYPMHELWVKDDNRPGEDWTTIQWFEPDIIVAPRPGMKRMNLFAPEVQPYTLIQPNYLPGYFWGRSEIVDLVMLQDWLSEHLGDARRLMGLAIDKVLAFPGYDGNTDELVTSMRNSGFIGLGQGASVTDLTPPMPTQLIPMISEIIQLMNMVSGFPPIMSGQGEPGVRAGVHADTLMKTGSPRLRDRSLLVERQCAAALDITLSFYQAKNAKAYWTNPNDEMTDFTLALLPEDRRISVDSHSGSPIYHDDNAQLLAWGVKSGIVTGESAIEQLPFAHKDVLIARLKEKEAAQKQLMETHPEFFEHGGGKKSGPRLVG